MATVPLKSSGFLIFGRICVLLTSLLLVTKAEAADFFVRDNTNQSRTLQTYRHSKGSYDDTTDEYEIKVPSGKYAEVRVSGERTSEDVACASGLCVGSRQYRNSDIVLTCNEGTSYVTVRLAISYFDYQIYACRWMYYIRITYYDLPTYVIKYSPGTYGVGSPQTATKTKGEKLVLKDAIFTRTDYLQIGWAKTDGGEKAYDLGASYTADVAITLYPFWKQRSPPDLLISSISTQPASPVMKGEAAAINFTVMNAGEMEAGRTIAKIFDSETVLGEIAIEPIAPGMSCEKSFALPQLSVGSHIMSVVVVGVPGEMDADNNSSANLTFEVGPFGFSVVFDSNGGGGVMPRQICAVDQVLKLSAATVMPISGMRFAGWACSNGKRYDDEMLVFNLAEPGETVTMTAIWEMSDDSNGVQLWEGGPYWATCNVGATKPEECGLYFWWGDTVGYKRNANNNGWVSVKDSTSFSFDFGNCPTYGKNNSQLQAAGYIDATGNLVAAHDAATAHLGAPWRMPTSAEIDALISNCDTEWTTQNGVYGWLVRGRGAYVSKSIFLPAAGEGDGSRLDNLGSAGYYWWSTPDSGSSNVAWSLGFSSSGFGLAGYYRYDGKSVRPVRGFAK